MLAGCELQFVESLKYIGSSKCSIDNVRFKFYTSFNVIYSRDIGIFYFYSSSKGAQSELVTLQLLKSYCFMLILCATEVLPLSKYSLEFEHMGFLCEPSCC